MIINEGLNDKFDKEYQRGLLGLNIGLPMPFTRLSAEVCGIQQGTYYLIAGSTGSGKSTLAQEIFITNPIQYCNTSSTPFKAHIEYFNLEIKDVNVLAKMICNWIYKASNFTVKISVNKVFQKGSNVLTELEKQWIEKSKPYRDFLLSNCNFIAGERISKEYIYKRLWECARTYGLMDKDPKTGKDLLHTYRPKDPNQFVILVFDNVNNLNDKALIDEVSRYFVDFRNYCNFTFVVVQQYNRNIEGMDRRREFLKPQLSDLKETSKPADDCDIALLTFAPKRFALDRYPTQGGYKMQERMPGSIKEFQDFFRMLLVEKNRDGMDGIELPFAFNGATGLIQELPKPDVWESDISLRQEFFNKFT